MLNYVTGAPTLLGAVLHKLIGKPFDALERDVLLDPLGISDTSLAITAIRWAAAGSGCGGGIWPPCAVARSAG